MSTKDEFLKSMADELIKTIESRGWTVEGDYKGFTAVYNGRAEMKYSNGEVSIRCDGEEVVRSRLADLMGR